MIAYALPGALGLLVLVVLLDASETAWPRPLALLLLVAPIFWIAAAQLGASIAHGATRGLALAAGLEVGWLLLSRLPRLVRREVEDAPIELVVVSLPLVALVFALTAALA